MAPDFWIQLPADLEEYRDQKPNFEQRQARKIDGSGMELKIFTYLSQRGWSDEEIIDYSNYHQLPKHSEGVKKDGNPSATQSRINQGRKGRERKLEQRGEKEERKETPHNHTPHVLESEHNPEVTQTYGSGVLAWFALGIVADWEGLGEIHKLIDWWNEIIAVSARFPQKPVSMMTARRLSKALVECGFVETRPINGKSFSPHLTEKGRRWSKPARGRWARWVPLKPPGPVEEEAGDVVEPDVAEQTEDLPAVLQAEVGKVKRAVRRRDPRHLHIEKYRRNNDINGYFRLSFKNNKIRYIQLLAPVEDGVEGPLWLPQTVGYDEEGLTQYVTVPAEEDLAKDPLLPLLPEGWRPFNQFVLPAVELTRPSRASRSQNTKARLASSNPASA